MELMKALKIFNKEINKKVVGYIRRGDNYIFITKSKPNVIEDNYYIVSENGVKITNPILSKINSREIRRI